MLSTVRRNSPVVLMGTGVGEFVGSNAVAVAGIDVAVCGLSGRIEEMIVAVGSAAMGMLVTTTLCVVCVG